MNGSKGHNYYINPLRDFSLDDLFDDFHYYKKLRDLVYKKLVDWITSMGEEEEYKNDIKLIKTELKAERKNFDNYYFVPNGVVFIYNPYHLLPWSWGPQHPEVSFDELLEAFPKEMKLREFITMLKS